jgi:small-conductance mechanosensitive channel
MLSKFTPEPDEGAEENQPLSEKPLINTPTAAPTAMPDPLTRIVDQVSESTGADRIFFIGLSLEDWLNVIISLAILLLSVLLIARLIYYLLQKTVARTQSKYDDLFIKKIRTQIYLLVGVIALEYGTLRLIFITPAAKQWLEQIFAATYVLIICVIAWRVVDVIIDWYKNEVEPQHAEHQDDAVLPLIRRGTYSVIIIVGLVMILSINNVNVDVLIAALGLGGLALSLAAQDSIANMISGVILLLDKPFRVGDRVEIQGIGTWGDVVDIGLRTTRIRTRDNRLVIIPNLKISSDQVINYTFPDPRYRVQLDIEIAFGQDIEKVRQIIIEAVENVEGVIPYKPVEALYIEIGDTSMVFRVRWWIESYEDTRQIYDRVNTALQKALDDAGIEGGVPLYDIHIMNEEDENGPLE